nr:unnamed protein product [Callosobruchus analis]
MNEKKISDWENYPSTNYEGQDETMQLNNIVVEKYIETSNSKRKGHEEENGSNYTGKRKYNGKWSYDIPKSKKILTNPCTCKIKNSSQKIQCNKVTQENREIIFSMFWNRMTWSERKVYIQGLVKIQKQYREDDERKKQAREIFH